MLAKVHGKLVHCSLHMNPYKPFHGTFAKCIESHKHVHTL